MLSALAGRWCSVHGLRCVREQNNQAATGLLYIAVISVVFGEMLAPAARSKEKWSDGEIELATPCTPCKCRYQACATSRTLIKWHFLTVQYCH